MSELVLVVNIKIKPENVSRFMAEVLANARAARTEPGCLQFDVLVDRDDPTKVMLYEIYRDDAAFDAHQQTAAFKHYLEHAVPLLESRHRTFMRRAE
jgi:quinol monooxygenase YgiN